MHNTELRPLLFLAIIPLILIPGLNLNIILTHLAERPDKCSRQTCIGNQGDVEVDGRTADLVTVVHLESAVVLRDIDHEVYFLVLQHLQS